MKIKIKSKKILPAVAAFALASALFTTNNLTVNANSTVTEFDASVAFNGSFLRFNLPLYVDNNTNRVLVPVRPVFEALGVPAENIVWDRDFEILSVRRTNGSLLRLLMDSYEAYVNVSKVALDTPARIIDDWIYVPLRFVCERFNVGLEWDETGKIVNITYE